MSSEEALYSKNYKKEKRKNLSISRRKIML
jgi:hypothetical protein